MFNSRRTMGEGVFAALLLAGSGWALYQSSTVSGFGIANPGTLPLAASTVLVGTVTAILVQTFRKAPAEREAGEPAFAAFRRTTLPPLLPVTAALIVLYAIGLEPLGFLLSSIIFLIVLTIVLQRGRIIRAVVVSVVSLGLVHLIFRYGFEVFLPPGNLF